MVDPADQGESLIPLISCISASGPQYPLLTRLRATLVNLYPNPSETVQLFITKIEDVIRKSERSATRPMFSEGDPDGEKGRERVFTPERPVLDFEQLARDLDMDEEETKVLREAVRRLEKATRSVEEPAADERGVRQL
jgi:hypothetical protein